MDSTSSLELGKRLKLLLVVTKTNRNQFAELAGVSRASVTYWVHGQIERPIGPKSMSKIISAFNKLGVDVTERWLRDGEGRLPKYQGKFIEYDITHELSEHNSVQNTISADESELTVDKDTSTSLAELLSKDINRFTKIECAVILKVDNSHYYPFLEKGDYIGGIWQKYTNLAKRELCIFKINNINYFGIIQKSNNSKSFQVEYYESYSNTLIVGEVELEKIAKVIRIWR